MENVIESFPVFPFDLMIGRIYARIWAAIAQKGWTVGAHDLIIAATAISLDYTCLLYTSPSPRDGLLSRMPSSA